jgi:hypothetical protein
MALGLWITVVALADGLRAAPSCTDGATEAGRRAGRKSSAWSVTVGTYSGVGSFGETKAIKRPPRHVADWATTSQRARRIKSPYLT